MKLINTADNNVAAYQYDAWGNVREVAGGPIVQENPYLFTGREYDWQTEGYYYRARSYDSHLGRFMQRDPAGMVDGANMYVYCGNDPVGRRDPSGMYISIIPVYITFRGFTSYAGTFRHYMLDCIWSTVSNEYVSLGAIASAVTCIWYSVSTSGIGYTLAAQACAKGLGTATVGAIVNCANQFQSVEHHSIVVWNTFVWYLTPTGYKGWIPT